MRDLATDHHDAGIPVMGVGVGGVVGLLAAVDDLEALAAQVGLERGGGQRAGAAAAGYVGHALGADMFGVRGVGRHGAALVGFGTFPPCRRG